LFRDHAKIPLDDLLHAPDRLVIIRQGLEFLAGAFAVAEMVFEADPEFAGMDVFFSEVQVAGAQRVQLPDQLHQRVHQADVRKRAEILRSVTHDIPGGEDPRKGFILYADPWVGLVILQRDIIPGLVFLNQIILKQERILFGADDDETDVGDLAHQHLHLAAVRVDLRKVAADPFLQILRLPHVDDLVLVVEELVHAGLVWKNLDDAFEVGEIFVLGAGHLLL
jgi:hypothetical protein